MLVFVTSVFRDVADDLMVENLADRNERVDANRLNGKHFQRPVSFEPDITKAGHPGSFSTIHANSLRGALEQLALMVMQTGIGLTREDTIAYAANVIDVIVQLDRSNGKRGISAIAKAADIA